MALVKIKSVDDITDGIFDVQVPLVMTATSTSKSAVFLVAAIGGLQDMEIEIDTGPAAFTAAQLATEVEAMVNAAVEAGIADPYKIPEISGIIRLYDDTGARIDNAYLQPDVITPIKAYDLI